MEKRNTKWFRDQFAPMMKDTAEHLLSLEFFLSDRLTMNPNTSNKKFTDAQMDEIHRDYEKLYDGLNGANKALRQLYEWYGGKVMLGSIGYVPKE